MEFHPVGYLLTVCGHMNFTRAVEDCAVSQMSLSKT